MPVSALTTFLGPVVSLRTHRSDARPVFFYGDSNSTFSWAGPETHAGTIVFTAASRVTFAGQVASSATLTNSGPVTNSGAVTNSGNVNNTGTFAIGSGVSIALLQRSVISVSPGAIAPFDSVVTTATISTMPADALILGVQQSSLWSGAYYDISVNANVSAASTLQLGLVNSTLTSVTPAAMNWTVTWMDPA